jgi:hypothetical protein
MLLSRNARAVTVAVSVFLSACGGGGGGSSDSASGTQPPAPAAQVTADVSYQAGVRDLRSAWDTQVSSKTDSTVAFNGSPPLAIGDIFLVQGSALRALSITSAAGSTTVTVEKPVLEDVVDDVVLNGDADLANAEFVPAAALSTAGRSTAQAGSAVPFKSTFTVETRRGFTGVANSVTIGDSTSTGLQANIKTFVAGKLSNQKWSAAGRGGKSTIDLTLELEAVVQMAALVAAPSPGICVGPASTGGLRYHIGSFRVPTSVPGTIVEIPVCIAMEVDGNLSVELLHYKRAWHVIVARSGLATPTASVTTLDSDAPASHVNEKIDATSATGGPAANINLAAYLETGVQLNMLSITGLGGQVQLGAGGKGTFQAGPTFTAGTWEQANLEPDLCLKVATDWRANVSVYAAFLGKSRQAYELFRLTEELRDYAVGFGPSCGLEVTIDPSGSFVPLGRADVPKAAATLTLSQLPGYVVNGAVEIRSSGSFAYDTRGSIGTGASAIFRGASGGVILPNFANAIGTGPVVTPPCGSTADYQAGDTPEDFGLPQAQMVRVDVPQGATTLAFSVGDCYFADNAQGVVPLRAKVRASASK